MENYLAFKNHIQTRVEAEVLPLVDDILKEVWSITTYFGIDVCKCDEEEVSDYARLVKERIAAHIDAQAAARLSEYKKAARYYAWSELLYDLGYGLKENRSRDLKDLAITLFQLCPCRGILHRFKKLKSGVRNSQKTKILQTKV